MSPYDYEHLGEEIYRQSFAVIRAEADLTRVSPDLELVAVRMIHACGMVDLVNDVDASADFATAARTALAGGATIFCDAQMVAHGITRARLTARNEVVCTLSDPRTVEIARERHTTRSAAAVDLWDDERLSGSVVAIGNAPTTLFRLLERLDEGAPTPAAIIGVPVGFIGAAESKRALAQHPAQVPFLTVHGRRGGSALAVAAVNALARETEL